MSDNWEKVQEIFFAAVDLPPAEQHRFLDDACRYSPDLRREIDSLLLADRSHSHDIDLALEAAAQRIIGADPVIGARFGPCLWPPTISNARSACVRISCRRGRTIWRCAGI